MRCHVQVDQRVQGRKKQRSASFSGIDHDPKALLCRSFAAFKESYPTSNMSSDELEDHLTTGFDVLQNLGENQCDDEAEIPKTMTAYERLSASANGINNSTPKLHNPSLLLPRRRRCAFGSTMSSMEAAAETNAATGFTDRGRFIARESYW